MVDNFHLYGKLVKAKGMTLCLNEVKAIIYKDGGGND